MSPRIADSTCGAWGSLTTWAVVLEVDELQVCSIALPTSLAAGIYASATEQWAEVES